MPQAPSHLSDKWDEESALKQLDGNFRCKAGVFMPNLGYIPTSEDYEALEYLSLEGDYDYLPDSC
jgi:hypothetical protein